ncbi:Ig-like domain-containing protein [Brevibacillus fluminis]|uniref:Ig-like domain-containing protein n=1 Tax=Brevibacillus fluminis TaxID=511487 RepID=UPI003F8895A6
MVFRFDQTKKVFTVLLSTSVILTMTTEALASPNTRIQPDRTSVAAATSAERQLEVKTVTAANGIITVKLTGKPEKSPDPDDFTFLQKIDQQRERTVRVTSFTWDAGQNTVKVAYKPIAAAKEKQSVLVSVLCHGVKTEADVFTIAKRNAKVADVLLFNHAADFVLTPDADDSDLLLTAIAKDADGNIVAGKKVAWSSDNEDVVTVDKNGKVAAVGTGTATITATIEKKSASVKVKVVDDSAAMSDVSATNGVVTVTLLKAPEKAPKLRDFAFTKQIDNQKAQKLSVTGFTWDEASRTARFTFQSLTAAAKKQQVVISASYADAKLDAAAFTIAAKNAKVKQLQIVPADDAELMVDSERDELQLVAIAADAEGNIVAGKTVSWRSDNTDVATVDRNGNVKAIGVGTATIRATVDGKSDTIQITVKPAANPAVTLGISMLDESPANDGNVPGVQTVTLAHGFFAERADASDITVNHLPAGLGISVTRTSKTQLTVSFTGAAVNHAAADSRNDLSITIAKAALAGAKGSVTTDTFGIRFADPIIVAPPGPVAVMLATGSLGTAGYGKITGLQAGVKYVVTSSGKTYGVQANGRLGAENAPAEALAGTEIIGLTNGATYKVEEEAAVVERALVAAYRNAASPSVIDSLLAANQLGLTVTGYEGLDDTGKAAVAAELFGQKAAFTSKLAIQNALNTAVAHAQEAAAEQANVNAYKNAVDAAAIQALLDAAPNALGLNVTAYALLGDTYKEAVAAELYGGKVAFINKTVIQAALNTAVAHAQDAAAEQAKIDAYKNAGSASVIQSLLDTTPNALGLDVSAYDLLDAMGKTAVAAELYGVKAAFDSKTAIQNALDTAVANEAKVAAYRLAANAAAIGSLLATNELGLTLDDYNLLDAPGKAAVNGVLLDQKSTFATKSDIQTAMNATVASEAKLAAYRMAADAVALANLLAANQLGLDVDAFNQLEPVGQETVVAELNNLKATFTTKETVQTALDAAVTKEAAVAAFRMAANESDLQSLLASNALSLTVTDYNGLDPAGKATVASELFGSRAAFTSKTAIQLALDTAVAKVVEQGKVAAYKNAANATAIQNLLDATPNALGLNVSAYGLLDAMGKNAVAIVLDGQKGGFTSKDAIQAVLDIAVANEAKVAAYRLAADATGIESLLATNALGLSLADYDSLDAVGKTAIAQGLYGQKTSFSNRTDIQMALDAIVPGEVKLAAYRKAAGGVEMKNLLDANLLGLTVTGYNGLDAKGKLAVANVLLGRKAEFRSAANIQSVLDDAVANEAQIAVYRMAGDAGAIRSLLDQSVLSLDFGDYTIIDSGRRDRVAAKLFDAKDELNDTDSLVSTVQRLAAIEAIIHAAAARNWSQVDRDTFVRANYPITADDLPFVENSLEYKYTMRGNGVGDYFNDEVNEIFQQIENIDFAIVYEEYYHWSGMSPIIFVVAGIKGVNDGNFEAVKVAVTTARNTKGSNLTTKEIQAAVNSLSPN